MLAVSNSIKNAYNQYTTQRKSKIKVGNNEYFIQNMNLFADAYDEGNIVGNAIAKTLEFDIETQYVSGLDEFVLYDGVWTGEEYEYINLGTFKLFEEQGADDFFSHITAYDKLVLFNKVYDPTLTTYPTTVYGLLQNICSQAEVILDTQTIVNGDKTLETNLFVENETLKDILRAICQVSGTFAVISEDKLKLKLKGTDTLTLSKYQLSNPEYKRTTWKINQVILGMQDIDGEYVQKSDEEDIERNGVHKIVINNNPFTYTQELRQQYIDDLFDQLKGFGYIAFETDWEGLPYVELGDSLIIDDYESLVLRYQIKSPDGLNSMLQAPSIIDSVIDYIDNTNDLDTRMRRTEYKVDKANGQITSIVENVSVLQNQTSTNANNINNLTSLVNSQGEEIDSLGTRITQTAENITASVSAIQEEIDNGVGLVKTTSVTIDDSGLNVSTDTSKISTTMTNNSFEIKDNGDKRLAFFGYDEQEGISKAEMDNLTVTNYFIAGVHRVETIEVDGEQRTGYFYIGG